MRLVSGTTCREDKYNGSITTTSCVSLEAIGTSIYFSLTNLHTKFLIPLKTFENFQHLKVLFELAS